MEPTPLSIETHDIPSSHPNGPHLRRRSVILPLVDVIPPDDESRRLERDRMVIEDVEIAAARINSLRVPRLVIDVSSSADYADNPLNREIVGYLAGDSLAESLFRGLDSGNFYPELGIMAAWKVARQRWGHTYYGHLAGKVALKLKHSHDNPDRYDVY